MEFPKKRIEIEKTVHCSGINSISFNADALIKGIENIVEAEKMN